MMKVINSLKIVIACFFALVSGSLFNVYASEAEPSCNNLPKQIQNIQKQQYLISEEGEETEQNNLYSLMRDYDKKLAEATIFKELYALNQKMVNAVTPPSQNEDGNDTDEFKELLNGIEKVNSDEHLETMKQMAAMDAAIKELEKETEVALINESGLADIESLITKCAGKNSVLCQALNNPDQTDKTKQLISSFFEAYMAHTADEPLVERKQKLKSYQQLLRQNFSDGTDFEKIYDKALALKEHSPALLRLGKIQDVNKKGGAYEELKKVQCCRYSTRAQAQSVHPYCESLSYETSKCMEYTSAVKPHIQSAIFAYDNYKKETYDALNYQFGSMGDDIFTNNFGAYLKTEDRNFFKRVFGEGINEYRSRRIDKIANEVGTKQLAIDKLKKGMIDNIVNIYRRGKIQDDKKTVNQFMSSSFTPSESSDKQSMNLDDYENIAKSINENIQKLVRSCSSVTDCGNFIVAKKSVENGDVKLYFEIANSDALNELFRAHNSEKIKESLENSEKELAQLKSRIQALQQKTSYQHLDQVKSFLLWDLKNRCRSNTPKSFSSVVCNNQNQVEEVDYLVASVGNITNALISEIDIDAVERRDLTNAGTAQRRAILATMKGACLGLANSEDEIVAPVASSVGNACERINRMEKTASVSTASEENQKIAKRFGSYDERGRPVKLKSTWSDIGTGAARALPNAANTLANPFFSGLALRNSIPQQEAYWKHMKFNNYSQQWWINNTPIQNQFYGMGSPYYYPSYTGYNFGGLNTSTTSVP
jgi:hypothetical protein